MEVWQVEDEPVLIVPFLNYVISHARKWCTYMTSAPKRSAYLYPFILTDMAKC